MIEFPSGSTAEFEDVRIIPGGCRDILPTLAFDVIVSDPPYGINFAKGETGSPVKGRGDAAEAVAVPGMDARVEIPRPKL